MLINLDAQLVHQGLLAAEQAATEANAQALVNAEMQSSLGSWSNAVAANSSDVHVKQEVVNETNTDIMEVS